MVSKVGRTSIIPDITNKDIKNLCSIILDDEFSTHDPDFHYNKYGSIYYMDDVPIPDKRAIQKRFLIDEASQKHLRSCTYFLILTQEKRKFKHVNNSIH